MDLRPCNRLRSREYKTDNRVMKLLIVDDHAIVREGLTAMLRQARPDIVVLQAGEGAEALGLAMRHADLDAVLLDLRMPGMDGISVVQEFGKIRPTLPVIVLSSSENPAEVRHALAMGALGYVPKSAQLQTLLLALELVLSGNVYVPPLMLLEQENRTEALPGRKISAASIHLTDRQIQVLRLLCQGLSNNEIGRDLGLSTKTVKAHITAIFKSLSVVSRTQAAALARQYHLV